MKYIDLIENINLCEKIIISKNTEITCDYQLQIYNGSKYLGCYATFYELVDFLNNNNFNVCKSLILDTNDYEYLPKYSLNFKNLNYIKTYNSKILSYTFIRGLNNLHTIVIKHYIKTYNLINNHNLQNLEIIHIDNHLLIQSILNAYKKLISIRVVFDNIGTNLDILYENNFKLNSNYNFIYILTRN